MRSFKENEDGHTAVQLGSGWIHPKNVSKPVRGHLAKVIHYFQVFTIYFFQMFKLCII